MTDRGPLPNALQKKKVSVEIRRLEHQIEHQEMEVMELLDTISRREENIESSKKEIAKQQEVLKKLEEVKSPNSTAGPGKD